MRSMLTACTALALLAGSAQAQNPTALSAQTFRGLEFRSIGPNLVTGRVSDLDVDPTNPSIWYLAVSSGNLWKTVNRGNSWTPIFDNYGSYSLGAVKVDPRNPSIVWLGTGENQSQRSVGFGDGLYKSTDAGASWQRVGLENSEHIQNIIIDPRNSDVVYVSAQGPLWNSGGDRGLYKTTDGGRTWQRVLHVSDDTGITDVIMEPGNPDVLYAAAYQRRRAVGQLIGGGPEAGIFKSTDAGANWTRLTNGLPAGHKGRITLAVHESNPRRIYSTVVAQGESGGFFRSDDAGASWRRVNEYDGGDPQYYGEIYVNPHNPDEVWVLEVNIQRTLDGGSTFERAPVAGGVHVDHHELIFDPQDPDHWWIGNDGGLYETFDGGDTYRHFTNLPLSQFYRIDADNARPFYNVCGGMQDNGSICGPSRSVTSVGVRTSDWYNVGGGDGFQPRVDPEDPTIVYSQSQNGNLGRLDLSTGQRVTIRPTMEDVRWHWDSPLIISPHSPRRLYYGGSRLFRSDDRGDNWTALGPDLTRNLDRDTIPIMGRVWPQDAVALNLYTTALSVISTVDESPLLEGLLYVGTDDGLIQVSEDAGSTWRRIDSFASLPPRSYVTDVYPSPRDANTVFATFNNYQRGDFKPYVLKSTDRGRAWTNISSNLPARSGLWSIVQDHVNPDLLFVGHEFGVHVSIDGGTSWLPMTGGMPTIQARDLMIQRRDDDLIVGTFGRGAFILDDYTALRGLTPQALTEAATLLPLRDAAQFSTLGQVRAAWGNTTYANPPYGAALTYHVRTPPPAGQSLRITIRADDGGVIRRLAVPADVGLNRVTWNLRAEAPAQPEGGRGGARGGGQGGGRGGQAQGPEVGPGRYSATLTRVSGETESPLGPPQVFHVVPLRR